MGQQENLDQIVEALKCAWPELTGSGDTRMAAYKIGNRPENLYWVPPILTFDAERHGAVVKGSKLAEIQRWTVNIADQTADHATVKKKLIIPREPEICDVLEGRARAPHWMRWYGADEFRILIGEIIPSYGVAKQTVAGRRRRFQEALMPDLAARSWAKMSANRFKRK
jgi:hypothetical protein